MEQDKPVFALIDGCGWIYAHSLSDVAEQVQNVYYEMGDPIYDDEVDIDIYTAVKYEGEENILAFLDRSEMDDGTPYRIWALSYGPCGWEEKSKSNSDPPVETILAFLKRVKGFDRVILWVAGDEPRENYYVTGEPGDWVYDVYPRKSRNTRD